MAGTKGEEAIVEGQGEIGGRKSVNGCKDADLAKMAKVEGNDPVGCRNLVTGGDKAEGGEEKGNEEELKEKVDRLRGLLEDDPKKLGTKEAGKVVGLTFDVSDVDANFNCPFTEKNGMKRVNTDKAAYPAKRAKVDGNEAAGCRNLVTDGDKAEGGGEKENEEEEELKEKVDRLRGLLEDDPKKLGNKDVEDVICYLDVDEIISLALKSDQGNGNDQCRVEEVEKWTEDEGDCEKVAGIVRIMLCYTGMAKRAEFKLLHEKLSPKAFTTLVLAAVDSNNIRRSGGGTSLIKAEERDIISKLCFVLPWKLFAHVLNDKHRVFRIDSESEEEEEEEGEECTPVQKEAAEKCDICFGKARHTGSFGDYCTFQNAIPKGTTVGTNYRMSCSNCGFDGCVDCDCERLDELYVSPKTLSDSTRGSVNLLG